MEFYKDQVLDSPSKNSYIGSYYQPPERLLPPTRLLQEIPAPAPTNISLQNITPRVYRETPDAGSKAVIAALKTLQEKIRRLELERKQAERNVQEFSQAAHSYDASTAASQNPPPSSAVGNTTDRDGAKKKEMVSQLQTAEARCQLLEKQLEYMRKMVENAQKDRSTLAEQQASLQRQTAPSSSENSDKAHLDKLDKLERECLKLNRTQTLAERKMELLERKLLEEEHERKLVQEKADELQRELEANLRLCPPVSEEVKPKKKKSKKSSSVRKNSAVAPGVPKARRLPFVAGTSTSPSHSVHANVQSVLHMMKHHQPQLCERVRSLRRADCGARRGLRKALSSSSPGPAASPRATGPPPLGALSDLLLALQDELGHMSFEHQELVRQMDEACHHDDRAELERDLELLVRRMEDKRAQITKLRSHQEAVQGLTQGRRRATSEDGRARARPPAPSPVKTSGREERRAGGGNQDNLQLLRDTQRLRINLTKDDIAWET